VLVTKPIIGGTGGNLEATNEADITQTFWALNEEWQAFARVGPLGLNRVPYTLLLITGPTGYGTRASNAH
jgi:hypothetical protein